MTTTTAPQAQSVDPSQGHALVIQPATWRDLPEVRALERACFGPDAWDILELLRVMLWPMVRLKAVAGGRMVGLVVGETQLGGACAWIATIGVLPEYQGRGIGARLLAEAEARLEPPLIKLTVRQSNARAIRLYEKFGYVPSHVVERYYAGGEAGIVMEKNRR